MFSPHQQYLGFSWNHQDTVSRYYVFTVLPFGLNSSCYLFTKLTRPLVYYWRAKVLISFIYIDDGLIVSQCHRSAVSNLAFVQDTIGRSGFVPNNTKCVWQPSQEIKFLGLLINSTSQRFFVPEGEISKLKDCTTSIISLLDSAKPVPVKLLASFAGQIISMTLAIGPVTRLMTRASYRAIESHVFWADSIFLPDSVVLELNFWLQNISLLNGFPFRFCLAPTMQIYSDASDTGFGGFVKGNHALRYHGTWTPAERLTSSTWRELVAVLRLLSEWHAILANQKVKWFTDNSNVSRIIKHGSVKPDLHAIALEIFQLCRAHDIIIIQEWLPRNENKVAHKISKIQDYDDWSVDNVSFSIVDSLCWPHTVDRFASPHNRKLEVFNARFWCRDATGVDAFAQDWGSDNNYLCPPVCLIVQTVKRMELSTAVGTLIIPRWPSAHFWPFICPDGSHLHPYVHDWRLLKASFFPTSLGDRTVFCENPKFLTLALRVDFKCSPRRSNKGFCCSDLGCCPSCV